MVRFILQRPIAVFLAFIVSIILGLFLFQKIPVSLLPNVDVPKIVLKIYYPNTSASVIESNITERIRDNMITLDQLVNVESQSSNHTSTVNLTFEYGTKMDLAYIAVNEKLDRLTNSLPKDLIRPQVIRSNTSDIPIVNIQLTPENQEEFIDVADLAEKSNKEEN